MKVFEKLYQKQLSLSSFLSTVIQEGNFVENSNFIHFIQKLILKKIYIDK